MSSKSVFAKRGAILRPQTAVRSIIRATSMRLKPIYHDIIDEVIKKTLSYGRASESVRTHEAEFSQPDINRILAEYDEDIQAVLLPATTTAARMSVNSVIAAFGSTYSAQFFNSAVRPVIAARIFKIVTTEITPSIEASLKAKFNKAIQQGWSLEKLADNLNELKGNYATIARTEVLSASSQAERIQTSQQVTELGIAGRTVKEWHTSGSGKERDSHIEAAIRYGAGNGIPYEEEFTLSTPGGGTESAFAPMAPTLSAANFINCQCHMVVKVLPAEVAA